VIFRWMKSYVPSKPRSRAGDGRLDVVIALGREPTVHPQFCANRRAPNPTAITRILINTNGIRLANEDALLEFLPE